MSDPTLSLDIKLTKDSATEETLREFVGKRADYYMEQWSSMKERNTSRSWNWPAFFAGLFWVGYRKMYKELLLIFLLMIPVDLMELFLHTNVLSKSFGIVIGLYLAFFGNTIYYKSCERKIGKMPLANESRDFTRQGGTSWLGVGLTVLLLVGYMFWLVCISILL